MKKYVMLLIGLTFFFPALVMAEDFLGAPVIPGGKVLVKTNARLELSVPEGHDAVLGYYKNALKKFKDIRIRDWEKATYIEDDGRLPWHSITISKDGGSESTVIIVRDNWTWILGTLVLRFFGVFIVLLILFISMSVSGSIISKSVARAEGKKVSAGS